METQETWKPLRRFKGKYEISNLGRVRRVAYVLTPFINHGGYRLQLINYERKIRGYSVHRLVAEEFIGNPPDGKPHVNHKDGNRLNNCPANLEWCSPSHNIKHSFVLHPDRQKGSKNNASKLTEPQAAWAWRMRGKLSQSNIAKQLRVCRETIARIHQRRAWLHVTQSKDAKASPRYLLP